MSSHFWRHSPWWTNHTRQRPKRACSCPRSLGWQGDFSPFQQRMFQQLAGCVTTLGYNSVPFTPLALLDDRINNLGLLRVHHRVSRNIAIVFDFSLVQTLAHVTIAPIQVFHRNGLEGYASGFRSFDDLPDHLRLGFEGSVSWKTNFPALMGSFFCKPTDRKEKFPYLCHSSAISARVA